MFWKADAWDHRLTLDPKGNQCWTFIGRTDAEGEAPILWPPDAKSWLPRKDLNAGKDWGQEEKGTTAEDEMVGWHHWLDGHGFEQTPGDKEGQGSLACCVHGDAKSWTRLSLWIRASAASEDITGPGNQFLQQWFSRGGKQSKEFKGITGFLPECS